MSGDLRSNLERLESDELAMRVRSGDLTAEARSLALSVLEARGDAAMLNNGVRSLDPTEAYPTNDVTSTRTPSMDAICRKCGARFTGGHGKQGHPQFPALILETHS